MPITVNSNIDPQGWTIDQVSRDGRTATMASSPEELENNGSLRLLVTDGIRGLANNKALQEGDYSEAGETKALKAHFAKFTKTFNHGTATNADKAQEIARKLANYDRLPSAEGFEHIESVILDNFRKLSDADKAKTIGTADARTRAALLRAGQEIAGVADDRTWQQLVDENRIQNIASDMNLHAKHVQNPSFENPTAHGVDNDAIRQIGRNLLDGIARDQEKVASVGQAFQQYANLVAVVVGLTDGKAGWNLMTGNDA